MSNIHVIFGNAPLPLQSLTGRTVIHRTRHPKALSKAIRFAWLYLHTLVEDDHHLVRMKDFPPP